jgi:hypothetical protein
MERQQVEETLAMLQAQGAVQQMMIRALLRMQPDPMALLAAWREVRGDGGQVASALPSDARHSRWLAEQMQCFAEDWTAELADLATAAGDAPPPPQADRAHPRSPRTGRRPAHKGPPSPDA